MAGGLDLATSTVVLAADRFLADGIAGLYDRRRGNGACKADERFDRVPQSCPHFVTRGTPRYTRGGLLRRLTSIQRLDALLCPLGKSDERTQLAVLGQSGPGDFLVLRP